VPSGVAAYSLNVTVIPHGPLPFITVWPTGQPPNVSTLNDYLGTVLANAAIVPAGTNGSISIYVTADTDLIVDINGYFVTAPAQSSAGIQSTAVGAGASSMGAQNTAVGYNALSYNLSPSSTNGNSNTAFGANALTSNAAGSNNVGIGAGALSNNASGFSNTAVGTQALLHNGTTGNNTAVGFNAMLGNTGGQHNVALGDNALSGDFVQDYNIAIGSDAGSAITGDSNIDIGNVGQATDSHVIRIGTPYTPGAPYAQQTTFIAGISGVQVSGGAAVFVNASGQLGVQLSSQRYKEDIQDMGTASDALMQLRPVQFRYKQAAPDGSKPLQFGLIAEEVAQVYPELIVRDGKGQIESVQYQQLPAMLLNELQKQHQTIERQEREIQALESRLAALESAGSR